MPLSWRGAVPHRSEPFSALHDTRHTVVAVADAPAQLLQESDPDPIYICEVAELCPHSTTAAANVTQLSVSPTSGPQGTKFTISFTFRVTSTIATGQLVVVVVPPDAQSFSGGEASRPPASE